MYILGIQSFFLASSTLEDSFCCAPYVRKARPRRIIVNPAHHREGSVSSKRIMEKMAVHVKLNDVTATVAASCVCDTFD